LQIAFFKKEHKDLQWPEVRSEADREFKTQSAEESTVPEKPITNEIHLAKILRKSVFVTIVVAVILGTASAQTGSGSASSTQTFTTNNSPKGIRAGHILVHFKATPTQDVLNQLNTAFGARAVGKIPEIGVTHLQAPPETGLALLEHLRNRSDVDFAEFDSPVQAVQTFQPNDLYYSTQYASSHYGNVAQWGPPAVSAPAAWAVTLGDRSIVIAIVDTGVDNTHPDLASKIVGEYSYVGSSAKDGFGHGTHVAGIAAAATNNVTGVAGMCPNCGILSVKVLNDQGSGYMSDVASGITYAASHGARVISMSLGGSGRSETLHSALDYAIANNALPVCAMGNNGSSSNTPEPAYWHDCLSVIATDQNGARASFSNYGVKADVAAPGVAILSTMPTYPVTLTTTYGYRTNYDALSGTSMATPMVAGIAGLVLSENPSLTPTQVAGIIMASSGDGVSWNPNLAFGVVNAYKAVSSAIHSDYVAPAVNLISPTEGATVSGLVTVQAAPTDNTTVHHVDIVQNGTRFMQVLTGTSSTSGSGKKAVTTSAWTASWPSTTVFNSSITVSVSSVDVFGNTSAPQNVDFTVQNALVTQTGTAHICWPSSSSCPNTIWQPVTTGVATEAVTHLHGTVTYSSQQNVKYSEFFLQVASFSGNSGSAYACGVFTTTVDCYPTVLLEPDGKSPSNSSGGQIYVIPKNSNPASEQADIQWTLTYPQ
jgi:thermitase